MNIIHKISFNSQGEYEETYLFNGQEITETQFVGLAEDLKSDYSYDDYEDKCNYCLGNCSECVCEEEQTENKGMSIKLNVSINPDDIEDILDTVDYLEEKLSNIKIKFSL
jgi:hypothetical protein